MRRLAFTLALLCLTATARADINIEVPTGPIQVGEVIEIPFLDAAPEWFHEFKVSCFPYEGTQCFVGRSMPETPEDPGCPYALVHMTLPGTYRISVATKDASGALDCAEAFVVVVVGPGPNPPPVPPDPPVPPISPLSVKVKQWVLDTVPVASQLKANALAQVYREASTSITTGRLTTADDVMAFVLAGSQKVIAGDRTNWLQWATNIKGELDSLWDTGKLKDVKSYVGVFVDIALGLEAVR